MQGLPLGMFEVRGATCKNLMNDTLKLATMRGVRAELLRQEGPKEQFQEACSVCLFNYMWIIEARYTHTDRMLFG